MRKVLFTFSIASLMLLMACGSDDAFQNDLETVIDQMNDMDYDEAIAKLQELEEGLVGDQYETGRINLVSGMLNEAEYMSENIAELEEMYNSAMEHVDEATASEDRDIELYSHALSSIDQTLNRFEDMTQLDMYQDLEGKRDELSEEILGDWLPSLQEGIESDLESQNFAEAEMQLNEMNRLHQMMPEEIREGVVSEYDEMIAEERERFVFIPEIVDGWNETVIDNDEGSIEVEGVRNIDSGVEVVISFNDYYKNISDQLAFSPRMILSDSDTVSGSLAETRLLEDKAITKYHFSTMGGDIQVDDISRMDVEAPFEQEEAIQVAFDGTDGEYEIPGIESIKELHRPEWTLDGDNFEVEIDRFFVEDHNIEITGVIKAEEDITIDETSRAYLPFTKEENDTRGFGSNEVELYADTEKDFEINHSFSDPITEFHNYIDLMLFEHHLSVDLTDGQLYEVSDPVFVADLENRTHRTSSNLYDEHNDRELINQSGDRVKEDSLIMRASAVNRYTLNDRFDQFTTTLHVHQGNSGVDYGTTEFEVYSVEDDDEVELYSTTIEEDHDAQDVEIDVEGVTELKIQISTDRGSEGRQEIILEEPAVE
ncbi:NPCBM/NEW2 domain-containing protein [Alkalibacillus silvisoli]|uniref:Glycosyl hydrolase family 98 putative carbohydrate-binding module domain-containing protein n=1 Tax=Alkalibacillus silvisoli TaxID=392823 RepID=A0ABN1A7P2_9BACI